jgi:glycosyltransferase involved in cell wall biosynthesis
MEQSIKIGFYIDIQDCADVDLRFPELGNPGIGGTQFSEIFTAYYLHEFYSPKLKILLFANSSTLLPPKLEPVCVVDAIDALTQSVRAGCDLFIFCSKFLTADLWQQLCQLKIKAIARSDNFLSVEQLNWIASCPQIRCHLCVGQEQLDLYRDHQIFKKSVRIYNSIATARYKPQANTVKQGNTVVYIGSIIHAKGFHVLAKVWPRILEQQPDAKLVVIGSGKLYERSQKLGKWGVAEESYEAEYIRPFLSDRDGNLIKSVDFAGLLGAEKDRILQNADVGVVNPTGETETFCISAVEIQACGTPVVSAAKGGLLDTIVHNHTGFLGSSDRELISNILYLLNAPDASRQFGENGINFVAQNFDYQIIAKQWLQLFIDIVNDKPMKPQSMKQNYFYNAKGLKEVLRIVKGKVSLFQNIPALIEMKPLLKQKLKFLKRKNRLR